MTDDEIRRVDDSQRYNSLSYGVDIINSLYEYSTTHSPKGLMRDLCKALDVDGYYRHIEDAFSLTSAKSPLSVYKLRLRLKLKEISTLADEGADVAYDWAVMAHMRSKRGTEFFRLQAFREQIAELAICEIDADNLIGELFGRKVRVDAYLHYLHGRIGLMPSYFTTQTKQYYAEAIKAAAARGRLRMRKK